MAAPYDAVLVLSFGGPEKKEDVLPFLENVLRGRRVPRERMLKVAEHYYHFGGRSPINDQNRLLVAALRTQLNAHGPALPVYWGNRNWHPLLVDTVREMRADGRRRALVFATSAFSSYSGCRQYREDIDHAIAEVGDGAPALDKMRVFYNHPLFIAAQAERLQNALERVAPGAHVIFTAHSIPVSMTSGCEYERQLQEASRLVAEQAGAAQWRMAYQSRSGPPSQPWLEPDIGSVLREIAAGSGSRDVVIVPIGFLSDHMEVLYDLDAEAVPLAADLGLTAVRANTVGTHPKFVSMIRELVLERVRGCQARALGSFGPEPAECRIDCCPAPVRAHPISREP